MDFRNSTTLDSARLERLFVRHAYPYRHDTLTVRVRYSRSADFSGTCYYATSRLFVNIGRHTKFPYLLGAHIARAQSNRTHWWREVYRLTIADPYQLALFVFLHELYHHLVKSAGRNPRRKEAMCDRFAARALVDRFGAQVLDSRKRLVPRELWDIQDVDAFVAKAPHVARAPHLTTFPDVLPLFVPPPSGVPQPSVAAAHPLPAADPRLIPVTIAGLNTASVRTGTRRQSNPRRKSGPRRKG